MPEDLFACFIVASSITDLRGRFLKTCFVISVTTSCRWIDTGYAKTYSFALPDTLLHTTSMRRILVHVTGIINAPVLPIGVFSEKATESQSSHFKLPAFASFVQESFLARDLLNIGCCHYNSA